MRLLKTQLGISTIELIVGGLLGAAALAAVVYVFQFSLTVGSEKNELWTRSDVAHAILSQSIDCAASRSGCTGNVSLYGSSGKVVIAGDESTRVQGFPVKATCDSNKIKLFYAPTPKNVPLRWVPLLPDGLPICVGVP